MRTLSVWQGRRRTKAPARGRRPAILPPLGLAPAQAQALRVPDACPPALLAVLVDIARRVATEPAGQGGQLFEPAQSRGQE